MTNEELKIQVDTLTARLNKLESASSIPFNVEQAFRARLRDLVLDVPSALADAPLGSITAPSGGLTIDSEARTAINTVITRLESLGLVNPN